MAERLIVAPLDGSELSEGALPYAKAFADATGATLLLVTVWGGAERDVAAAFPDVADELLARGEEHYEHYLTELAGRLGGDVETHVLVGNPAEEVLHLLDERQPELLVLATHGRSGIGRWFYGSVAAKLTREAPVTTLAVGPQVLEREPGEVRIARILVPLDGSELSESAIAAATELARRLGAQLLFAQALSWANQAITFGVPDADVGVIDEALREASEEYLARAKELVRDGIDVTTHVLRGPPADALHDFVAANDIDLVVMASHSRGGLARAALGSVADRMLQGAAPVLLVRPEAPAAAPVTKRRHCHACGRAVPYIEIDAEDRCLRCGQHLHACANCVYFDGMACMLQRSEVRDAYPGRDCPLFQFRETVLPGEPKGR